MTGHIHELGSHPGHHPDAATAAPDVSHHPGPVPRWVGPVAVGGAVIVVLLLAGVLSPTFVLYGVLFGGCALMHLFGHGGHGGHGGHVGRGESGGAPPSSPT